MGKMFKILLLLPVLLACNKASESNEEGYSADEASPASVEMSAKVASGEANSVQFSDLKSDKVDAAKEVKNTMLMKEGSMGCMMEDYIKGRQQIETLVKQYGGYISSESEMKEAYRISNDLVIRIGSDKFDALMDAIAKLAVNVDFKRITATDVTEEYVDIETRLKTKKEVEKRYVEFLSRAKSIEEVLKVENELRIIREEIEAREGRLKFLKDRVSYSTINLNIYQNLDYSGPIAQKPGFFNKITKSFKAGWSGILNGIVGFVYLWPLWLVIAVVFFIIKRQRNRRNS